MKFVESKTICRGYLSRYAKCKEGYPSKVNSHYTFKNPTSDRLYVRILANIFDAYRNDRRITKNDILDHIFGHHRHGYLSSLFAAMRHDGLICHYREGNKVYLKLDWNGVMLMGKCKK